MNVKTRRTFPNLGCGKRPMHETRVLCMLHYADLIQVESDAVIVFAGEMSSSHMSPYVASHNAGIGSFSFSFSPFRFMHIHPWLLLTFFVLALWRETGLCIRGVLHANEEHAWSRTVTHGLTHSRGPIRMPYTKAYVMTGGTRKKKTSHLLSSRLISVSATKLCKIFVCATPTGRWRFDDKSYNLVTT